jgi:hypothetical protein
MATIAAAQIDKRLQQHRFLRDATAMDIRSRVRQVNAEALTQTGRGSA